MPNGGSDCCMTCWFNPGAARPPQVDYAEAAWADAVPERTAQQKTGNPVEQYCGIRQFPVENATHTYCLNNPRHTFPPSRVPLGPVFGFSGNYESDERRILIECPDTPEIRDNLLEIANSMINRPETWAPYLIMSKLEVIAFQLAHFREERARPVFEYLANLNLSRDQLPSFYVDDATERLRFQGENFLRLLDSPPEKPGSSIGKPISGYIEQYPGN